MLGWSPVEIEAERGRADTSSPVRAASWPVVPDRRVIAHLDCDAFYVSVELLRRPELVGKPVVVAGSGPRAVVTTASYEARAYGVGSASPASQARRLCPDAVFVAPDFEAYRAKSREVWERVRERLPVVQQVGLDEGYADVTESREAAARAARAGGRGAGADRHRVSVGIGPNRLVAKVASDLEKPQGFVAMGREEACRRLAERSPRIIPGIGPKTAERLAALGYTTIGALQQRREDVLARRFGANHGRDLHARAHFHGSDVVEAESGPAKSRSTETTFDRDIARPGALEAGSPGWRAELARGCSASRRAGGRSPSRSGSTTGRRSRARERCRRRQRRRDGDARRGRAAARLRAAAARAAARRPHGGVRGAEADGRAEPAAAAGRSGRERR